MAPPLSEVVREFRTDIEPLLDSGILPRRDPTQYRFRVTYPPTGLLEPYDHSKGHECLSELPVNNQVALYVHVPFCKRICTFCHFDVEGVPDSETQGRFVDLLLSELHLWRETLPRNVEFTSVYVGGGTPTALQPKHLGRLLAGLRSTVGNHVQELTVESSPGTFTPEIVDSLKEQEVTRVSVGIQELSGQTLRVLGRDHSATLAIDALDKCLDLWPNTTNIDLIFGFPHQSPAAWYQTIEQLCKRNVPSITVYQLHLAAGTALRRLWERTPEHFSAESSSLLLRWIAHRLLSREGRSQDPVDWYTTEDRSRCKHQHTKWQSHAGLVALGPGTYWGGPTIAGRSLKADSWSGAIRSGSLPIARLSRLSPSMAAARYAVFALKTKDGISASRYAGFKEGASDMICDRLRISERHQLFTRNGDSLALSATCGFLRAEELAEEMFDEQTRKELASMRITSYQE